MKPKMFFLVMMAGAGIAAFAAAPVPPEILRGHVPAAVTRLHLPPVSRLEGTNQLTLAIGLPLRNREALTNLLQQLYDPASTNYHHFLTPAQFTEKFGPKEEDYQAVIAFSERNGFKVTGTHPDRALVDVRASVAAVEKALHVKMQRYQHPTEPRTFFAPDAEPSLDLAVPVLNIAGLNNFTKPHPSNHLRLKIANPSGIGVAAPATGSTPNGAFIGNDFRAAYVPGSTLTGSGQTVGLVALSGFYQNDITNYESQADFTNVPVNPVLIDGYDGGPGDPDYNREISLDIEMAISMAPGLNQVLVYEAPPNDTTAVVDDILSRMAGDDVAKQMSASLLYDTDATSDQYFQQFAAQGQSFFNASDDGDAWVNGVSYGSCEDPNITIVGGTTLTTSGPGGAWVSETVWNWGAYNYYGYNPDGYVGSSGGVSTDIAIPGWQQGISMSANHGSTTMRNVPDVALTADNVYFIYGNGSTTISGGTSAASPLWAGFTALVNEQAQLSGRPPVGFLNPALYAIGQGIDYGSNFHDITTGDNTWDQSLTNFFAVPGYDLCTGWGTPAGTGLINALAVPDFLQVSPLTGFNAGGGADGPFTTVSQMLTLTNAGAGTLNWTVSSPAPWLDVSITGGTLPPEMSTPVAVSLDSAAYNLPVGNYTNILWFTNLNDSAASGRQFTLSILAPPAIITQPANQAVPFGATAVFSVGITGAQPLFYQWWANGIRLADGATISGSATGNLTISNAAPANAGSYYVTVSNSVSAVTSSAASLSITPSAPLIVQQPAGQTMPVGAAAWFAVSAYGDAPAYQWTFNGTALPGATNATLVLTNLQSNQAGNYAVTLTNALGGTVSSNAVLTVLTGTPVVATFDDVVYEGEFSTAPFTNGYDGLNWSNFFACNGVLEKYSGYGAGVISPDNVAYNGFGNEATVSQSSPFNLLSADLTAAWNDGLQFEAVGYSGGTVVYDTTNSLSATAPTNIVFNYLNVTEVDFFSSGGVFHASYPASSSPQFAMDNMAVVESSGSAVNASPVVYNFGPPAIFLAEGQSASLCAAAVGQPPLAYQWQLNGTNLPGQTGVSLDLTDAGPAMTGSYAVKVSNTEGTTTSPAASVIVAPPVAPLITAQPQNQSVRPDGSAMFNVRVLGVPPFGYQWQFFGTNIFAATNAGYAVAPVTAADAGGYSVVVTNAFGGATSSVAVLAIVPTNFLVGEYGNLPVVLFPDGAETNLVLQMAGDPASGNWVTVSNGVPFSGLEIAEGSDTAFFRLAIASQPMIGVAAGSSHSLFIKNDGSLWGMGDNSYGQLGNGTNDSVSLPGMVFGGDVTNAAAGQYYSLYLKNDGSLWGIGYDAYGQLGGGSYGSTNLPVEIVAGSVTAVAAGYYHSLYIRNDGSLWGMGNNGNGQLGGNGSGHIPAPILPGNVMAVAAGGYHTLFVKDDGSLWGMGADDSGQLGDGSTASEYNPELVVQSNVTQVAAGYAFSFFIKNDGSLWGMGADFSGQLGDNHYGVRIVPAKIMSSNVVAVAAGYNHSLFLKRDGSLWTVGDNGDGELGDGTYNQQYLPEQVVGSNVVAVAAGMSFSLFLKNDGSLWGMGDNSYGQLGDSSFTQTNRPVQIIPAPKPLLGMVSQSVQPIIIFPFSARTDYGLQMTTNLSSGNWTTVSNAVSFIGVQITNAPGPVFFRLY